MKFSSPYVSFLIPNVSLKNLELCAEPELMLLKSGWKTRVHGSAKEYVTVLNMSTLKQSYFWALNRRVFPYQVENQNKTPNL